MPLAQPSHPQAAFSYGISLLESMVAIVLLALGVLAVLALQLRTLADTQTSTRRVHAIRLIEDLGERMRANPHAWDQLERYVSDWQDAASVSQAKPCHAQACSAVELAQYDLQQWRLQVAASLPLGQSRLFLAPGENLAANRRQLGVMIRWRETAHAISGSNDPGQYRDPVDATKSVAEGEGQQGVAERGGEVVCQDDDGDLRYTCHLQYLALNARCAVERGAHALRYYCAGS